MSALIDRGQAALNRRMKQAAGRTVSYVRGATTLILTAWLGRTLFAREPMEPGGAAAVWGDRDYLIAVADLADIAPPAIGIPAKGDRITETINGVPVTFEVSTPDTGEPCQRFSDQTRTVYRIHTKRVS